MKRYLKFVSCCCCFCCCCCCSWGNFPKCFIDLDDLNKVIMFIELIRDRIDLVDWIDRLDRIDRIDQIYWIDQIAKRI